jgi:hypothetical protein
MWWMSRLQSGGSIEMWHSYFGPGLTMYGIDINPYCKASCSANHGVAVLVAGLTSAPALANTAPASSSVKQRAECAL